MMPLLESTLDVEITGNWAGSLRTRWRSALSGREGPKPAETESCRCSDKVCHQGFRV